MEAFLSELSVEMIKVIVPVIISILGLLLSWVAYELKRFITSRIDSKRVKDSFDMISGIATNVVKELELTIRKAYGDGKLTDDEKAEILEIAKAKVKEHLPTVVSELGSLGVDSLDDLIVTKINSAVYDMKEKKLADACDENETPTIPSSKRFS